MSFALSAGVSGLKVHQSMLDVAGNNLANVNTTAYKASNITFSELLSQTVKKASAPAGSLGGTNPQQMGSGVGISSIIGCQHHFTIIIQGRRSVGKLTANPVKDILHRTCRCYCVSSRINRC